MELSMKQKSGMKDYLSQRKESQNPRQRPLVLELTPIMNGPDLDRQIDIEEALENFSKIAGETPNTELIQEGWEVLIEFCKRWDDLQDRSVIWTGVELLKIQAELVFALDLMSQMDVISTKCLQRMKSAVNAMVESWMRHLCAQQNSDHLVVCLNIQSAPGTAKNAGNIKLH